MCGSGGNSKTFLIPSNQTFLLQPLTFQGPCKSPSVQVKVFIDIFYKFIYNFTRSNI